MGPLQIAVIVGVGFFFLVLMSIIKVVQDFERLVILRFGTYQSTRGPGIVYVLPFGIEKAYRVDMREKFIDIPAQTAITKDNASIMIDFLMYYRIIDPMLSVLKVDHVERASVNIATTTLRAVIGDIELDGVLSKREQINDVLRVKLDEATERWGLKVTAVEIREIEPPREILDAMNRQMSAERDRRAQVTMAEGEREASITQAEGHKRAAILKAEGQREAAVLEAQGQKEAQELKAMGYAKALEAIHQTASGLDEKTMALQYMEMLGKVGSSPSSKFIIPMELVSFVNQFAGAAGLTMNSSNGHTQEKRTPVSGD
ncbi:MAG: SPFH domain-containing protein [Anaerolineae bacterium]|nr:SPFH domain-containing protein [Anaerolineae bacterium]MDQ7033598.1 SPFH domain-containing protein [Anaerolineae bacterium]